MADHPDRRLSLEPKQQETDNTSCATLPAKTKDNSNETSALDSFYELEVSGDHSQLTHLPSITPFVTMPGIQKPSARLYCGCLNTGTLFLTTFYIKLHLQL